ncbi:MAG: Eco57I restriction-modification methylase domain-containing protein, partial [Crinalium sp.]
NIKVGNSIVDDSNVVDRAFNWQAEFPQIVAEGGFDVVIGNPPYVRQELLSPIKPYLKEHYESYDGVADLYTYFYEKGLNILKPGGMLSYIVTNKWLKSGYGKALRKFFANKSVFEQIIDFGHAPIFEDADTFPCIVAVRNPVKDSYKDVKLQEITKPEPQFPVIVCPVPRSELANINLNQYIKENAYPIPWSRFNNEAWSLELPAVDELMRKVEQVGVPLKHYAGVKPLSGIKTGFNEAFLIDEATKNSLIQADSRAAEIIKPYLRGQDIERWIPDWKNLWIILLKSSSDCTWAWSKAIDTDTAEEMFAQTFPSVYKYMKTLEDKLRKRQDQGRYWWELRSCAYYKDFEQPKIIHTDITWRSQFAFTSTPVYLLNTAYMWSTADFYLLAVVNSPLMWAYMWRNAIHGKDEALRLIYSFIETLPIAPPTDEIRTEVEEIVTRLIEITKINREAYRDVLEWLQITYKIEKLGQKLEKFANLELNEVVDEVRKRMRKTKSSDPLSPATLKALKEAYNEYAPAIQIRRAEALKLEHRLSDLVNQAYKLTPEEIDLMWKTAPPRMPISLK